MTETPHVVILGAGFGGLAAANRIRGSLDPSRVRITVIDKRDWFMVGFAKLWIIRGTRTFEDSTADINQIAKKGIGFVREEITGIDPSSRSVKTQTRQITYDFLIVALGSRLAPEKVPGLSENGLILYDHGQLLQIREKLGSMRAGRLALAITGIPYKCPPAPFEAALLISSMLEEAGVRDSIRFDIYSPAPTTLPAAGPEVSRQVLGMLSSENISFHGGRKIKSVERNRVVFEGGEAEFDLLLAVPPHVAPEIVYRAGLAQRGGFIKIGRDCRTSHQNVYAIGDVTALPAGERLAVPKAGIFAEGEGETVADDIVSKIKSEEKESLYDGRGGCFLESGKGTASLIEVDMFGHDGPVTSITESTPGHLDSKMAFEKERFAKWF